MTDTGAAGGPLTLAQTLSSAGFAVMGVVNVTPDSFSDGGRYLTAEHAIAHGVALDAEGAAYLDIGGESTRPGAEPIDAQEELRRVIPVIEGLVAAGVSARISIDSSKAAVVERALAAGATLVNDVTALRFAPQIASLVASSGAELCLMHMLTPIGTRERAARYHDVVSDVKRFLEERMSFALAQGVEEQQILLDPGFGGGGFGKDPAQNLELLRRLPELLALGRPVLVGTSRKSFIGELTGASIEHRLAGTLATNVFAYERGARVFRVHDVREHVDALRLTARLLAQ